MVEEKNKKLRVCKRCGRMFEYQNIGYGYCYECTKIDNEIFQRVKDYILEHGTATAQQVSDAVGVSVKMIYTYLRQGRVEIPENSPIFIRCEMCGTNIRYGRFCPECAAKAKKQMNQATAIIDLCDIGERADAKKKGVMHTYDHENKRNRMVRNQSNGEKPESAKKESTQPKKEK